VRPIALLRPKPALCVRLKARERCCIRAADAAAREGLPKASPSIRSPHASVLFVEATPSVANFAIPAPGAFFGRRAAAFLVCRLAKSIYADPFNLKRSISARANIEGARVAVVPAQNARHDRLAYGLKRGLAASCLLIGSLLPVAAVGQISGPLPAFPVSESLLPYPAAAPRTPQEQPSEFAPLGVPLGSFFLYPRGEVDEAYNSNIFATSTSPTRDWITALTSSFDLLSNFPRDSLNFHAGSLAQFYLGHSPQNTQDVFFSTNGTLDLTAGSYIYGNAEVAKQHISYGAPNSPGSIAEPVTYWNYTATAGYLQQGLRFSYEVDVGVTSAQYNAAQLVSGGVLPQSYQDGTASSAAITGIYEIIPDYRGYVRFTGSLFDYWHTVPGEIRPNFTTYRIDLGLQILPTNHIIYGDAYVGYLVQNFQQSSLGSTSTPDYGGDLIWSITPRTTLTFSGLLTYNTGTPGNIPLAGNSYLSKTFTGTVSHEVLPNLQLFLTGNYINNSFQGISQTQNVFLVNPGVRYQVNRNLYLGGDIYHVQQTSTASGGSFSQNIFTLRVGTQF
jgi:hypothetical protein